MSVLSDIWIRQQCQTPTHVLVWPDGSRDYLSPPFSPYQLLLIEESERIKSFCESQRLPFPPAYLSPVPVIHQITEEELAAWEPMITPYEDKSVREVDGKKVLSYGRSSYGYDARVAPEFRIFTNINQTVIDPLDFDPSCYVEKEGDFCIIPPNSFVLTRTVERLRIPRHVIVEVLTKSTMARVGTFSLATPLEPEWCFTGETKVALTDGTEPTFLELIKRHENGEKLFAYTVDKEGEIAIEQILNPRMVSESSELVEVVLDNGERIRCTPDHKFMLKNMGYIEAKDLTEGASLFPLYRYYDKKGYESVASPIRHKTRPVYTHKLADEWNIKNGIYSPTIGEVRHHIDFNPGNNNPTNIQRMTDKEHRAIHEEKEGYSVERSAVGKKSWSSYLDSVPSYEIVTERFKSMSDSFWKGEKDERHEKWLEAHKKPRPYRMLKTTSHQVLEALKKTGSIVKAALELGIGETSMYRRFNDVLVCARECGYVPTNHKVVSVKKLAEKEAVYCLTIPNTNNFALASGVFVHNCGYVTLEFANTTNLPVKLHANMGGIQLLFHRGDQPCERSYADKGGKYQNQPASIINPMG